MEELEITPTPTVTPTPTPFPIHPDYLDIIKEENNN